jgi:hypothetical protein
MNRKTLRADIVERDNEKEKSKAVKTSARRAAKVPYVDELKLRMYVR